MDAVGCVGGSSPAFGSLMFIRGAGRQRLTMQPSRRKTAYAIAAQTVMGSARISTGAEGKTSGALKDEVCVRQAAPPLQVMSALEHGL